MRDAVESAIAAMGKWLAPSDAAAVTQARMLARQVDELEHAGDVVKALNAHGRLTRVLTELGGTPTVRMAHELRSLKLTQKAGDDGGDDAPASSDPPSNVTNLRRPPKRRA